MSKELDYLLKGETFLQYFRKDSNAEARRMYQMATKSTSNEIKARGHAYLAYALLQAYLYNWYEKTEADALAEMEFNAEEALKHDGGDYQNRWIRAAVHLYRKEFDPAKQAYDAVRNTIANDAPDEDQWAFQVDYADMLLLTGDPGQALVEVQQGIAASKVRERWFYWVLGWAHYMNGQFQDSLDAFKNFRFPRNAIRKNVIANLVALGRVNEAKKHAIDFLDEEKAQNITYANPGQPVFAGLALIEARVPFKNTPDRQLWTDRLQQAFDGLIQP